MILRMWWRWQTGLRSVQVGGLVIKWVRVASVARQLTCMTRRSALAERAHTASTCGSPDGQINSVFIVYPHRTCPRSGRCSNLGKGVSPLDTLWFINFMRYLGLRDSLMISIHVALHALPIPPTPHITHSRRRGLHNAWWRYQAGRSATSQQLGVLLARTRSRHVCARLISRGEAASSGFGAL